MDPRDPPTGPDPPPSALPDRVSTLVAECVDALERGEPDPVGRVCADAPELRAAVEEQLRLLEAHGMVRRSDEPPRQIGPFRIVRELGSGGMGSVFLAEQEQPVRRQVAIKIVKLGMDSREVLRRFQTERQALALMNHPGIARVYDAGITEAGRPYFAMEFVKGVPLTTYCDRNRVTIRERLEQFREVCAAVQHAHTKGVLHRDLKPGNILVALQDGRPQPKIIDFGLAKAIDHRLAGASLHTREGAILGTPEYMSPEQAGVDALDVDTRTDVYSLGVILYELLTGELPFDATALRKAGPAGIQRILRDTDPPRPSSRISTASPTSHTAGSRGTAPAELRRHLRGDLDWIVLKALEKDRTRRYETAHELSADVDRHLRLMPVAARPQSTGYLLRRFVQRHRAQCAAAAGIVLALVAGGVATFVQYRRAEAKAVEASTNAALADQRAREALARKAEFDQLAAVVLYERALASERELDPPWPDRIDAMTAWLAECDRLLAMRPLLQQTVADLEARSPADTSTTFQFEQESQQFLLGALRGLLPKLEALAATTHLAVERRLRWARQVELLTHAHPNAPATWQEARDAIARADGIVANELYAAQPIDLAPQLGLVPIGMNPKTKLWEFYELRSAWDGEADPATLPIPRHDERGNIDVGTATGIVLVLLPGGQFLMGAQKDDPSAPNHDPQAEKDERPCARSLAAFFLARHELTQGQWLRLSGGEEPSSFRPGENLHGATVTLAYPVEQVDWQRCHDLLARHGLALPTEAQWEYGCRAGTATPWYPGPAAEQLADHANLGDATARPIATFPCEPWTDGFVYVAPVGALAPNEFGLHDVHGNVWEWCRDRYADYDDDDAPGDGENRPTAASTDRTARGGAFMTLASFARSANRNRPAPGFRSAYMGCRAARALVAGAGSATAR